MSNLISGNCKNRISNSVKISKNTANSLNLSVYASKLIKLTP